MEIIKKEKAKEFQNKITVAFTVMPKSIFIAMMTHSIDNNHTPNHFHMKFKIQIAPFIVEFLLLTEVTLNPDI